MNKYGLVDNLVYHYKNMLRWEPKLFVFSVLVIIPSLIYSLMNCCLPSVVVYGIEKHWEKNTFVRVIMIFVIMMWVVSLVKEGLKVYCENFDFVYRMHYINLYSEKKMNLDYEMLEEANVKELAGQAHIAVFQGKGIQDSVSVLENFTINLVGVLVYGLLLAKLSPIFVASILMVEILSFWLVLNARKREEASWPCISSEIRKMEYITYKSTGSVEGKDIRVFNLCRWLSNKYIMALKNMEKETITIQKRYFVSNLGNIVFSFLRNIVSYIVLLFYYTNEKLTSSQFIFYLAVINSCAIYLNNLLLNINEFGKISQYFSYLREFLDIDSVWKNSESIDIDDMLQQGVSIEFKDVTYSYANTEEPILKNFNLVISKGEKLAVLGMNGAGKSTIAKLLCGFYQPQRGEILINGINRKEFSREQYYKLISAVFQDFTFLPITLGENISGEVDFDRNKFEESLKNANFFERYKELPLRERSLLIKQINEQAIEFSGGENQKILFARALYKNAPILILDEPTAALDPISENELYLQFAQATVGKTVLFISHRLASTAFCDRVVLIENGRIIEEGTHEQLIDRKGRYYTIFEIQKNSYVKDGQEDIV